MLKKHEFWAMLAFFSMLMCILTGQRMTGKHSKSD